MSKYIQMIFMDTWNMSFRLDLPREEFGKNGMVMPGESATVKLTMLRDMPVMGGQSFTLRENKMTVATGIVTKLLDPIPTLKHSKLVKLDVPNK